MSFIFNKWMHERDKRESKLAVAEPGEHAFSQPRCPHCGEAWEHWWDGAGLNGEDATVETECGKCEKTYVVTMHVETSFTTKVQS